MLICCPNCNFSRTVDESRIPPTAQAATCPKCHHKFRFRDLPGPLAEETPDEAVPVESSATEEGFFQPGFGAPPEGLGDAGRAADEEDIWDRVASLGEYWADADESLAAEQASEEGRESRAQPRALGQVPWELLPDVSPLKAFCGTVRLALLRPARLFTALGAAHKIWPAVVFFLIVAVLHTYLFQAWLKLLPGIAGAFGFGGEQPLFELAEPLQIMLAAPLAWLIFLLAFSIFSTVALRLFGYKKATWPGLLRLVAYTSSPLLLAAAPFLGSAAGILWSAGLLIYGICRIFRANPALAVLILLPVYLCLVVLKVLLSGSF